MRNLTSEGQAKIAEIAQRHGVSTDGVLTMLDALQRGGGTMAQFSHPDFGGSGQWMRGGMTMVSDLFNNALKAKVDGVCNDLSYLLGGDLSWFQEPVRNSSFSSSGSFGNYGSWWPAELGQPNSSGGQNDIRYAYFGHANRLAVDMGGTVTVYDTGDHVISGVSQQQGNGWTLTFSSQYGTVPISSLRVVSGDGAQGNPQPEPVPEPAPFQSPAPDQSQAPSSRRNHPGRYPSPLMDLPARPGSSDPLMAIQPPGSPCRLTAASAAIPIRVRGSGQPRTVPLLSTMRKAARLSASPMSGGSNPAPPSPAPIRRRAGRLGSCAAPMRRRRLPSTPLRRHPLCRSRWIFPPGSGRLKTAAVRPSPPFALLPMAGSKVGGPPKSTGASTAMRSCCCMAAVGRPPGSTRSSFSAGAGR